MSALFGKQARGGEQTVLLIDVESGSVATALARITPGAQPKLFAEKRVFLAPERTVSAARLARGAQKALEESLAYTSTVAARIRNHGGLTDLGTPHRRVVFLHAPWTQTAFDEAGNPNPAALAPMLSGLERISAAFAGDIPASFHSFGVSALPLAGAVLGMPDALLMLSIGGEVGELVLLQGSSVLGHATMPTGSNAVLRTLEAHAGMPLHEARSALRLASHDATEAALAAKAHAVEHFKRAAQSLFGAAAPASRVYVFGAAPANDWFARALADDGLSALFPEGGEIRAVKPHFFTGHVAAHAGAPDAALLLETLFADSRFGR